MAEHLPSNEGLCIAICTLEAPQPLSSVLRAVGSSTGAGVDIEVLLVHGREAQPRIDTLLRGAELTISIRRRIVANHGFSADRRSALEWASDYRNGWSVLFLDDDDIPEKDLIRRLWDAHLERPGDIVAGVVTSAGRLPPAKTVAIRPVKFHGASTMLIPGPLVRDCSSWLPLWVDHCGGEDTALCAEAGKRGVRVWEVSAALAHELKPSINGSKEHDARRALHEAWVFSLLCRTGVIPGWRAGRPGRLASSAWNLFAAMAAGLTGRRGMAKRRFARSVGAVCGLLLMPPPRAWLYCADAPRRLVREGVVARNDGEGTLARWSARAGRVRIKHGRPD